MSITVNVESLERRINSLAQALIIVLRRNIELERKVAELEKKIKPDRQL